MHLIILLVFCMRVQAKTWYDLVLCENFLQDLLWGGNCEGFSTTRHHPQEPVCGVPVWRQAVYAFLRKNPSPEMSELVQLAHLATVVPEPMLQQSGKRLSHRYAPDSFDVFYY